MSRHLASPLARYGFTVCAVVALLTAQPGPFLVTTVLALGAWRCSRRPRRSTQWSTPSRSSSSWRSPRWRPRR
ncbi:hypothetical protein SUDANB43_05340 [Streptomyces sp. enrichment culture]